MEDQSLSTSVSDPTLTPPIPPSASPALSHGQLTQQLSHHLSSLASLVNNLTIKAENVDDLKKEAEMWKTSFMRARREFESTKSECDVWRERAERAEGRTRDSAGPPFSVVLIDGDGLIFHESLLTQGRRGGQQAAQTLLSALPEIATRLKPESGAEPRKLGNIVVMIFVNKAGLAGALLKANLIPSFSTLDSFFTGFSASHDLFSVVDVGNGKEATDAKIREYLKLYAAHAQCGMILLGASHDNGYATVLSSLKTESRLNNLLLLKGYTSLASQLNHLNLDNKVVSLPQLFRTERIPERPSTVPLAWLSGATPSILTGGPCSEREKPENTGLLWNERQDTSKTSRPVVVAKGVTDDESDEEVAAENFLTNADRRKAGIAKKPAKVPANLRNKNMDSVRYMDPRPCHSHYLSISGCRVPDCQHGHDYNLTDTQVTELAKYAKQIVCPYVKTHRCRFSNEECVYGHICPQGSKCTFGDTCRFKDVPRGHPAFDTDFSIPTSRSLFNASKMAGNIGYA